MLSFKLNAVILILGIGAVSATSFWEKNLPKNSQKIKSITGKIHLDKSIKNPKILLLNSPNLTQLDATNADSTGKFVFMGIPQGKYYFMVKYSKNNYEPIEFNYNGNDTFINLYPKLKSPEKKIHQKPESLSKNDYIHSEYEVREVPSLSYNQGYIVNSEPVNQETYNRIEENGWKSVLNSPLSTFSADVDKASYSNIKRIMDGGNLPHKDAVRIEEMINYFTYNYEKPKGENPLFINSEIGPCPWNKQNLLVKIGLKAEEIDLKNAPVNNITFLIDVSGSMASENKLGLVKKSMEMIVNQLRPQDKVSIVVYAGAAGAVLESCPGNNKSAILNAINNLNAGGSTAGAQGIQLAYQIAEKNYNKEFNNRIILCTDGDFNVGISNDNQLIEIISEKRKSGVFLSIFGFGYGNIKDGRLEQLANKGNGSYGYINNLLEAKKYLVEEFGSSFYTVAKDVKIQVEFNPNLVKEYRLIGYENRKLNDEDFNNDKIDAGEIGSGHTVTAVYEIIPQGSKTHTNIDPKRYTENPKLLNNNEWMFVKVRYKKPDSDESKKIEHAVIQPETNWKPLKNSEDFRFSSAVIAFGMYLRDSEYLNAFSLDDIIKLAKDSKGIDEKGERAEFIKYLELVPFLKKIAYE